MIDRHAVERLEVAMATLQAELDDISERFDVSQLSEENRAQHTRLCAIDVAAHFEIVRAVYAEEWSAEVIEIWRLLGKA